MSHIPGRAERPTPAWLVADDYVDEEVGPLATGKEADVVLVERRSADRSCLLVHKRYRPRRATAKGELEALGFQSASTFRHDHVYREGRAPAAKSRDRRAIARKSRYGRRLLTAGWAEHELRVLTELWHHGADVPYPVGPTEEGLLMEYVGDRAGAAPQLARARLGGADLRRAADQVVDNVAAFWRCGLVHADLSAYNVLWWEGQVRIIDVPQAVDAASNLQAYDLLHRDIDNVSRFFRRRGVDLDVEEVFADVLSRG